MAVKITLEYASAEEAVIALGKLIGGRAARAATKPVQTTEGAPVASEGVVAAAPAPASPVAPSTNATRTRKPRSDAGKPRGPYRDANGAGASAPADNVQVGSTPTPQAAPAPAASPQTAAPEEPKSAADGQQVPPVPAAAVPTPEEVQKAVETLFNTKGYDTCAMVLSRFGVKRAKDMLPEHRAEFITKAAAVSAGTEQP